MVQTYVLDPMAGDLRPKHLCLEDLVQVGVRVISWLVVVL
jgi:hypothetical protein